MWSYKGPGFIPGIPARDLTAEEVKKFGVERIRKSGLYIETKIKKPAKQGEEKK